MQRIVRTVKTRRSTVARKPARATVADRAQENSRRDGEAHSATSLILAGPDRWRLAVEQLLAENQNLAVAANIVCNPREVDIYDVAQGDVVLIAVDGEHPNLAIEMAMELQAKDRGTGIALVLPDMSAKNLRTFYTYAGSWSLISAAICGDRARLGTILESAGRGMSWVDPAITRLLKAFENGTVDFDREFDDSDISNFVQNNKPADEDDATDLSAADDATDLSADDDVMDLRVVEIDPDPPVTESAVELQATELAPDPPITDSVSDASVDEPATDSPVVEPVPELKRTPLARVLVTDDSNDVRHALKILLEDAGYEVMEAEDGAEAVKLAQSSMPDLVLLDVMMPNMDGFTALKLLKSDPTTKRIPVIMVSARGGRTNQSDARDLGAFDYIRKPWSDGEVEMTVKWALSRK